MTQELCLISKTAKYKFTFSTIFSLGNQELHVVHQSAPPPVFNKFNSLDRRALSRRHHQQAVGNTTHGGSNSMGLLKLAPHSVTMLNGGSESLPPVSTISMGGPQRSLPHPSLSSSTNNVASPASYTNPVRTTMNGQYVNTTSQPLSPNNGGTTQVITTSGGVSNNNKLIKEPERRHSSYDPASRGGGGSHYATSTVSINGENSSITNYNSSRGNETGTPSSNSASSINSTRLRLSNGSGSNKNTNTSSSGGSNSTLPKTALTAQRSNPINTNGLPDPFGGSSIIKNVARKIQSFNQNHQNNHHHHGSTSLYSSQESLSKNVPSLPTTININQKVNGTGTTNPSQRPTAGTPQFQNLSGTIQQRGGLSQSTINTSSSPFIIQRSISGNNLHSLESASTPIASANGVHPVPNSSGHNPTSGSTNGRNHTSGSSSGCSSSSAASQHSNGSGGDTSVINQTPSPSDSAVGDLESMLREKDTEINYLRETMEQNEQVIFKVGTSLNILYHFK